MTFVCKDFEDNQDFHNKFEASLFKAKGVTLVLLILISVVYQITTRSKSNSKTLLSTSDGKKRVLKECGVTVVFGLVSAIFVIVLRSGFKEVITLNCLKNLAIISLILGLFCFAMESSGFTRFLAEKDTQQKSGLYYEIDQKAKDIDEPEFVNDPFISSTGYVLIMILVVFVIFYCLNMFRITHCGYSSNAYNISDTKFTYDLGLSPRNLFILELLVVGVLNCIPPFLSPVLRNEKTTLKSSAFAMFTLVVASCLQFMFQYSGIFHSDLSSIYDSNEMRFK